MRLFCAAVLPLLIASSAEAVSVTDASFGQIIQLDGGTNVISDTASADCFAGVSGPFVCTPNNDSQFTLALPTGGEWVSLTLTAMSPGQLTFDADGPDDSFFVILNDGLVPFSFNVPFSSTEYLFSVTNSLSQTNTPQVLTTSFTLEAVVSIAAVPLPAGLPLLATGLLGLALLRRRAWR